MTRYTKRIFIGIVIYAFTSTTTFATGCRHDFKTDHILIGGLSTVINGWVRGNADSFTDAARLFFWGAGAGYGHWEAKRDLARGNLKSGLAQTYLYASIVDNISRGYGPFDYVRYGFGPIDMRFKIPLINKRPGRWVTVGINATDLLYNLGEYLEGDKLRSKGGFLYKVENSLDGGGPDETWGKASGYLIQMSQDAIDRGRSEDTFRHEAIHIAQHIEFDAYGSIRVSDTRKEKDAPLFDITLSFGSPMYQAALSSSGYENRWNEMEAYSLVEQAYSEQGVYYSSNYCEQPPTLFQFRF